MIGLLPILARWRSGLGIAGALAFLMLALAANHYRHAYHTEKAAYAAFKASAAQAAVQATKDQMAVIRLPAILSKDIAEKSSEQAPSYYADVRAAAERMRKDSPRCPSAASLPGADHAAPVNDGPGVDPGMVSITADAYQHYNDNTARLAKVRQDALELIAAGAAKSE